MRSFVAVLTLCVLGFAMLPAEASTATVTEWCFQDTNGDFTLVPNQGSGAASAGGGITLSDSAGNASASCSEGRAWSASSWTTVGTPDPDDYFEFAVSTVDEQRIVLSFDDRASGTGPQLYDLLISSDGSSFTPFAVAQPTSGSFGANPMNTFDLSALAELNDNPNVKLRLQGYAASSGGGTWRIDNLLIESLGSLAVDLTAFSARSMAGHVLVSWETASEVENTGFNLYRSTSEAGPETMLGFVPSQMPGAGLGAAYQWQDDAVTNGETYYYWLEDIEVSGATTLHGPVTVTYLAPAAVTLASLSASHIRVGSPVWPWVAVLAGTAALGIARPLKRLAS